MQKTQNIAVSVLGNLAAGRVASRNKELVALSEYNDKTPVCSAETGLALGALRADVGLDVGLLDSSTRAEMPLGLAHGGASKQESVRAYYNYIFD